MVRAGVLLALVIGHTGCGSLDGSARGTCRVRYGTDGEAPAVAGGERTDRVTMRVHEDGDVITMTMGGCTLLMHSTPPRANTNPHYLVDEGSTCTWDLPGLGSRTFAVADRPRPAEITDGVGYEAYANYAGREIFVQLEARVEQGRARFDCQAERRR